MKTIRVGARDGLIEIQGSERLHRLTPDEARELVAEIYDAIPQEFNEKGEPLCPKCGEPAEEDRPGFWVCPYTECDGYHQTVWEGEDDREVG